VSPRRPVTAQELKEAVWQDRDYQREDKTLRSHLSTLRKSVREALDLPQDLDPISNIERGRDAAWEVNPELEKHVQPSV